MSDYLEFLSAKTHQGCDHGFEPLWLNDELFDFQRDLVTWGLRKGRGAIFSDCGTGKTFLELVWSENVVRKTNGRVLILTPLAVASQTAREAEKFSMEATVCRDGKLKGQSGIFITNYERLHYFDSNDFEAVVADESGILKNVDGVTRAAITDFMRKKQYRLLCTATPSPNDYIELGTSSEAIGELGFMDMVSRFFKKSDKTTSRSDEFRSGLYRFRGHAERDFWRWVCSWARAVRKPSDLGYPDDGFILPELITKEHVIKARRLREGWLFDVPAVGLQEQREERRRTIEERCEKAAELASEDDDPVVSWCQLNDEGDLLEKLIPNAVQISGKDSDERKEEVFEAFQNGQLKKLVTKSRIAAWGMNWQHCAHQTSFPSHSFEAWYQSIRRSWRFGQTRPVRADVITTEGEKDVLANLQRKQVQAEHMIDNLVAMMNNELNVKARPYGGEKEQVPAWL